MPAKDFALSKSFYETGFEKLLDGDVPIFRADPWWAHIDGLDLPGKFNVPPPRRSPFPEAF
jgi:hypothetical protein